MFWQIIIKIYSVLFILCATHATYTLWKLKGDLHILQLNSYRTRRYALWLKSKFFVAFRFKDLLPLLAIVVLFLQFPFWAVTIFFLSYLGLFINRSQVKAKKALQFTSRAIRLYLFNCLILLGLYGGVFYAFWQFGSTSIIFIFAALIALNVFSPIFMLLCNFVITPFESLINRWYFWDAQKIIRSMPNLLVIGITGSFGKTTTKYALYELLRHKFNVLMTPASFNTPMGITKIIRQGLKPTHEIFIVEMSAKQKGDIAEICRLVRPKIGVLTAIGFQHLESFGSIEAIQNTKYELIESLPVDGKAFFNFDNEYCRELALKTNVTRIFYGTDDAEVISKFYSVRNIEINANGSNFTVAKTDGGAANFHTKLLGKHNVENILAAIAVASELSINFSDLIYPVKQLQSVSHRLELRCGNNGVIYIDDAFNANPIGSAMALDVLKQMLGNKKIIVTPGLIELGSMEYELNKKFGTQIAEVCDYVILVGKQQTAPIQDGLQAYNFPVKKYFIAVSFDEAYQHLQTILEPHDVVLFENDLPDNYNEN